MANKTNNTKVVTGIVRLSYEHVWEPASINGSNPKYSVSLIIPKDDVKTMRFWNSHRDEVKHKAVYTFTCPYCGREFQSIGNPNRKYCSRECVANARRKGGC